MEKSILAKKIFETCYLTGHFTLRSGKTSNEYFDKYRMESHPELLQATAEHLAPLIPKDIDFLAGLEMGGIPIVTALSLQVKIPAVFVRKEAKTYGTKRLCEGKDIKGKKLCIIEDVITTGGQVIKSTQQLREAGAIVDHVLCVIHRGEQENPFQDIDLKLQSLFTRQSFI